MCIQNLARMISFSKMPRFLYVSVTDFEFTSYSWGTMVDVERWSKLGVVYLLICITSTLTDICQSQAPLLIQLSTLSLLFLPSV